MMPATKLGMLKRCCLRVRLSVSSLTLACLLIPAALHAQVTYTGVTATQNFGSQAIGSPSAAKTFSFSITAGTTVGSIAVVTQGAPNLDFTNATGSTCTAMTYASASTCTVNATFKPRFAGGRMGAIVFFSAAGNTGTLLAVVPIRGIGLGPQIGFAPVPAIAIDPLAPIPPNNVEESLFEPSSIALDGAGDLYIADTANDRVVETPAGGGMAISIEPTVNGDQIGRAFGVALDGAGDLFIADADNQRVVEVPAGGGTATAIDPTVNGVGLSDPEAVAVDGAGDLFIADGNNGRVLEVPAGGGTPIAIDPVVNGSGLSDYYINALAVDGAGDLFIGDIAYNRVVEVPAGGGAAIAIAPTVNGEPMGEPLGLALDGAGDLFITDTGQLNVVVEVPAGSSTPVALNPTVNGKALHIPEGMTVDGAGNLYICDNQNNRIVEVERSQPPALNFPTPTPVGSTDTTDGAQTVKIQNIGNQALAVTALSYPADFSEASGDANACTRSTSLNAGQECDMPIGFTPEHGGALSEDVTLTDNALNVTGPQQSIAVTGTASSGLTSPTPGSTLNGPRTTFIWTPIDGATGYDLWLGTTGVGSNNLWGSGVTTATSVTFGGLPTNGETIYARLFTFIGGTIVHADFTYTATTPAMLTSPPLQLTGKSATFQWTSVPGATGYDIWLGTTGAGSNNLWGSGAITATSVTFDAFPTNGEKIYIRLFTFYSGGSAHTDYIYTAAP